MNEEPHMNEVLKEELEKYSPLDLARAEQFYGQSPDGQYDRLAELCIAYVLHSGVVKWKK